MSPAAPPVNPTPEGLGTVHGIPRLWLRLEGATLLGSTLIAYAATGRSWWLVAIVVLLVGITEVSPDSITEIPHP